MIGRIKLASRSKGENLGGLSTSVQLPAFGIELLTSPNIWGDTSLSFPLTGDGSCSDSMT
jgi:hypothetical protein